MEMQKIRKNIFLAILIIGTVAFLYLLKPFAYPIFWAAVIAGIFGPMYKGLNRRLRHPNLSTAIMLIVVLFVDHPAARRDYQRSSGAGHRYVFRPEGYGGYSAEGPGDH